MVRKPGGISLRLGTTLGMLALVACSLSEAPPQPSPSPTPTPVQAAAPEQVQSLAEMTERFEELQREADAKNAQVAELLTRYQRRGGKLPPGFGADLTDEQRQLLAERIQQERIGMRKLLQDILDRDVEIRSLREQVEAQRKTLPGFVEARQGDRHDRIVREFLQRNRVAELEARRLAEQINLQEPLVPGFHVYLYRDAQTGAFGSWVTRGRAHLTPREATDRVRVALESELDAALTAAGQFRGEVQALSERKRRLESEVMALRGEADSLLTVAGRFRDDADAAREGARYMVGTRKQLQKDGIIAKSLFGPQRLKGTGDLKVLDLAREHEIVLDASTFGLTRIKKATIVPDGFKAGRDYDVSFVEDGAFVRLRLLDPGKFRRSTFVVTLE